MIRMIELDDGSFIPRECCTVTNPTTSGGKSVIDDIELPCGADCTGSTEKIKETMEQQEKKPKDKPVKRQKGIRRGIHR